MIEFGKIYVFLRNTDKPCVISGSVAKAELIQPTATCWLKIDIHYSWNSQTMMENIAVMLSVVSWKGKLFHDSRKADILEM